MNLGFGRLKFWKFEVPVCLGLGFLGFSGFQGLELIGFRVQGL